MKGTDVIRIHTLLTGQPGTMSDEKGTWRSAIFRTPVAGPVELEERGLAGDQVADTEHHGSLYQAVCCHPIDHYAYWNDLYGISGTDKALGPGSVGENWTLEGLTEHDACVGDIYAVGDARVQVTGPRYPCSKQERKVGLPGFLKRTMETRRTGFYLRVLTPGIVSAGDFLMLEERPYPELTVQRLNDNGHGEVEPGFARRALEIPELMPTWKYILRMKLGDEQAV